ncbi:cytochrome c oxidase accessory protein CcoG [Halobacteriovorax sp. JY17]|uniref:cytochrome c oxidase accessory protein CcoG n=1 Tax=Halobacteriovorax sp. JY17 TaxID=2014617 RepID=UPI000C631EAF|nr:cytochrome c oxidase accessory protein CcoG [Halobacteriovorax sp. JY17]PIK15416.1 MAG: cytochrome c oxidase accessory protein CcoG [Halobacteriovorax sp. JY17]
MGNNNPNELHEERLATTDADGHRVYLYPEDVKGKWRTRRTWVYYSLIFLYLFLPWINIDGKQSILLDISKREFTFFGMTLLGHNAPLLLFVLLAFVFLIGFVTSIWGRVWCGWACPQTVFIDAIFNKIELLVEGNARKRKKLDDSPLSVGKAIKKLIKWSLFIFASMHIAHSFIGYFVGVRSLVQITLNSPFDNIALFGATWTAVGIILFDFAWFKEQFCLIACPYGRFQSVMMDENSLVIAYDYNRGEPRREKGQNKDEHADCVDCYACVKACPTGIDIRRGTQLECIACTNCIDACDEIMLKVGKPEGLIRFETEQGLKGLPTKRFSLRNISYLAVVVLLFLGFFIQIEGTKELDIVMLRGSKTPFTILNTGNDKLVANHFKINLSYKGSGLESVLLKQDNKDIKLIVPRNPVELKEVMSHTNIFFRFPPSILENGTKKVNLNFINPKNNKLIKAVEVQLVGPIN